VGDGVVETVWWQGEVRLHGAVDAFAACGAPRVWPGGWHGPIGQALRAQLEQPPSGHLAGRIAAQAQAMHLAAVLAVEVLQPSADMDLPAAAALAPVFRFVDANLHLPLSRSELAARAGLAPSRFHEVFLDATGDPPMAWVRRRRLSRAAELLAGTTLGMAEIASRVGLCDAYHLNKRFRAAYGMPPTRFRARARS
jgi:transcriptional regulator GlxA family with amidase domain